MFACKSSQTAQEQWLSAVQTASQGFPSLHGSRLAHFAALNLGYAEEERFPRRAKAGSSSSLASPSDNRICLQTDRALKEIICSSRGRALAWKERKMLHSSAKKLYFPILFISHSSPEKIKVYLWPLQSVETCLALDPKTDIKKGWWQIRKWRQIYLEFIYVCISSSDIPNARTFAFRRLWTW